MNDEELLRYSRHLLLPQVDVEGQQKLKSAKVMIIGLGGLGSPVALYLAAAGVGELIVCDFDKVELSNLQRQIIHGVSSLGQSKVESAIRRLEDINPLCQVRGLDKPVSESILAAEVPAVDLVLDCTDNLSTRLLINQYCVTHKKPLITAAAIRMEGQQVTFFNRGDGPCYQCLFKDIEIQEQGCSEAGVLATSVGIIGIIQAQEALKLLLDIGNIVDGSLLLMDGMSGDWRRMQLVKRENCPVCNAGNSTR